jgi:integrase
MIVELAYLRPDPITGIFTYRRKFPKGLRPFIPSCGPTGFGRVEIKVSMQAKSMNAPGASGRFAAAVAEFDRIVAMARLARAAAEKRAAGAFDMLDAKTISIIAQRFHAEELAADEARRRDPNAKAAARSATEVLRRAGFALPEASGPAEWTVSIRAANEWRREAARSLRACGDDASIFEAWGDSALASATEHGIELEPGGPAHRALCEALNDAAVTASEDALRRLDGDLVPTPPMPDLKPREPLVGAEPSGKTLGDLLAAYRADKEDGWAISTRNGFAPVERVMREVLGGDLLLADITREHGRKLFDVVKRLPKGLGTLPHLRGVSVMDAIEMDLPGLSPKSINGTYLASMKTVFKFGVQEHWMERLPMDGLSVVDPVHEADKRDPFTIDQVNAIFSGAPWTPRDDNPSEKPIRYWGPLIALFQGMRRSEIAQLLMSDMEEVAGVPVFLIKATKGSGKRTKTRNARRMLPLHPELIRLGFLAYVKRRRDSRANQLWEGEQPNGNGQWGDGFSDWFLRLLDKRQVTGGTKLGLHSFRHNFQDALREAGLHGTGIGNVLTGRAGDTSNNYGSSYPTWQLKDAVASLTYPGLVLPQVPDVKLDTQKREKVSS